MAMNPFERRKLILFITCVGLAILAWFFFALSNRYIYKVSTQAHYINYPQEKAFHSLQSDTVSLQVEGTGWQLLFATMRISPPSIDVDLKRLNTTNYVTFSEQLSSINRQLGSSQRVVSVVPDTLYFDFSKRNVKKVAVRLRYDFQFRKQHGISGPIEVVPQYVMVSGPAEDLKSINYWLTDSVKRSDVYKDISVKPMLKKSLKDNISIYPNKVDVKVHVAEFTEKSFDVPLRIINNTGHEVKLLPEKVKITLLAALNNYPKITPQSVEASINVDNWQASGYSQLPVKLSRFPAYCKLVRIEPQIVDFIIR
jgi:YbbR domain-containing protein